MTIHLFGIVLGLAAELVLAIIRAFRVAAARYALSMWRNLPHCVQTTSRNLSIERAGALCKLPAFFTFMRMHHHLVGYSLTVILLRTSRLPAAALAMSPARFFMSRVFTKPLNWTTSLKVSTFTPSKY